CSSNVRPALVLKAVELNHNSDIVPAYPLHCSRQEATAVPSVPILNILSLRINKPPGAPLVEALPSIVLKPMSHNNCGVCLIGDLNVVNLVETNKKSQLHDFLASFDINKLELHHLESTVPLFHQLMLSVLTWTAP
ncbi:hypothetical protein J6590_005817, partial [Homalodisca vitripennis]